MLPAEPALAVTCAPCLLLAFWWDPMMALGVTVANLGTGGYPMPSCSLFGLVSFFLTIFLNFHDSMNNTGYHSVFLLLHNVLSQR